MGPNKEEQEETRESIRQLEEDDPSGNWSQDDAKDACEEVLNNQNGNDE